MNVDSSFGCKKCGGTVEIVVSENRPSKVQFQVEDGGEIKLSRGAVQLICKNKNGSSTCHNVVHEWSID